MGDADNRMSAEYNNADVVAKRRLERARKYSKAAIALACISLFYIAVLIFLPPVKLFSIMRIVMLVLDKIFLYVLPVFAVLFAIFGFQEHENEFRTPALALSIISVIIVVITIVVIILASIGIVIDFFKNLINRF